MNSIGLKTRKSSHFACVGCAFVHAAFVTSHPVIWRHNVSKM